MDQPPFSTALGAPALPANNQPTSSNVQVRTIPTNMPPEMREQIYDCLINMSVCNAQKAAIDAKHVQDHIKMLRLMKYGSQGDADDANNSVMMPPPNALMDSPANPSTQPPEPSKELATSGKLEQTVIANIVDTADAPNKSKCDGNVEAPTNATILEDLQSSDSFNASDALENDKTSSDTNTDSSLVSVGISETNCTSSESFNMSEAPVIAESGNEDLISSPDASKKKGDTRERVSTDRIEVVDKLQKPENAKDTNLSDTSAFEKVDKSGPIVTSESSNTTSPKNALKKKDKSRDKSSKKSARFEDEHYKSRSDKDTCSDKKLSRNLKKLQKPENTKDTNLSDTSTSQKDEESGPIVTSESSTTTSSKNLKKKDKSRDKSPKKSDRFEDKHYKSRSDKDTGSDRKLSKRKHEKIEKSAPIVASEMKNTEKEVSTNALKKKKKEKCDHLVEQAQKAGRDKNVGSSESFNIESQNFKKSAFIVASDLSIEDPSLTVSITSMPVYEETVTTLESSAEMNTDASVPLYEVCMNDAMDDLDSDPAPSQVARKVDARVNSRTRDTVTSSTASEVKSNANQSKRMLVRRVVDSSKDNCTSDSKKVMKVEDRKKASTHSGFAPYKCVNPLARLKSSRSVHVDRTSEQNFKSASNTSDHDVTSTSDRQKVSFSVSLKSKVDPSKRNLLKMNVGSSNEKSVSDSNEVKEAEPNTSPCFDLDVDVDIAKLDKKTPTNYPTEEPDPNILSYYEFGCYNIPQHQIPSYMRDSEENKNVEKRVPWSQQINYQHPVPPPTVLPLKRGNPEFDDLKNRLRAARKARHEAAKQKH